MPSLEDEDFETPDPLLAAREYGKLQRRLCEGLAREQLSETQLDTLRDQMDRFWEDMTELARRKADNTAAYFVKEGKWPQD